MHLSEDVRQKVLNNLAALGGEMFREEDVLHQGKKLIIPEGMTKEQAIRFLKLKIQEDENPASFSKTFKYRPWDGGVALVRALEKAFGSVIHHMAQGMFGPRPPAMITIPTGVNETIQVPWGPLEVPLLPGLFITPGEATDDEHGTIFSLECEGPRKYRFHVEGLFNLVEEELNKNSIYRGKAFDGKQMPNFLDLDSVDPNKIIYPEETWTQLEASVMAPIRYPEQLSELGIGGKRSVLLHGPFGTGKTSTAMIVGQEAVLNGRTFVFARPGKDDIEAVFKTARLYQPSVVFCEDLDQDVDEHDSNSISSLLDLFDGFTSKGTDILAILTTNYPEKIIKGMVRPGRLDALIYLGAPDAPGVAKLVQNYIEPELLNNIDWDAVAASMGGEVYNEEGKKVFQHYLPAFIAEACHRALRYSVVRNGGKMGQEITTEDLVNAANGLRPQWDMMQDAPEHSPADTLSKAHTSIVSAEVEKALDKRF